MLIIGWNYFISRVNCVVFTLILFGECISIVCNIIRATRTLVIILMPFLI